MWKLASLQFWWAITFFHPGRFFYIPVFSRISDDTPAVLSSNKKNCFCPFFHMGTPSTFSDFGEIPDIPAACERACASSKMSSHSKHWSSGVPSAHLACVTAVTCAPHPSPHLCTALLCRGRPSNKRSPSQGSDSLPPSIRRAREGLTLTDVVLYLPRNDFQDAENRRRWLCADVWIILKKCGQKPTQYLSCYLPFSQWDLCVLL